MLLALIAAATAPRVPTTPATPGPALLYVTSPGGTTYTLRCLAFQTTRKANAVGQWSVTVPVEDKLDASGSPVTRLITAGWTVSLRQENNNPYGSGYTYLVTSGVAEKREYVAEHRGAVLQLSGSFQAVTLTRTEIHGTRSYDDTAQAIANDLSQQTVLFPSRNTTRIKVDFNSGSLWAADLKVGELARLTLRETWDGDALEFTPIDGAPDSGITLVGLEQASAELRG